MRVVKDEFYNNGAILKGKLFIPDDLATCRGIVIFTHGLGYCARAYKINGEHFAENGYLLATYNLRGHAGTDGTWTLNDSADDLIAVIDSLNTKYKFKNKHKIGLFAHSTGALISLLASFKDKRVQFGSIVTIVTSMHDSFIHWYKSGYNQKVKDYFKTHGIIPPLIDEYLNDINTFFAFKEGKTPREPLCFPHRYGMLSSKCFYDFYYQIAHSPDIIKQATKIKIPLILFKGEYDEVIPVEKTDELYDKLGSETKALVQTDSTDHFQSDSWELIQDKTIDFFDIITNQKE